MNDVITGVQFPSHAIRRSLLERFVPRVRYDSLEAFYADSVAEMLTDPAVVLRRADNAEIARPGPGVDDLSPAFFTTTGYHDGQAYAKGDHIAFTSSDYREQAHRLRSPPGIADIVYGHFAHSATDGHFWLQYWYFMLYNDAQLIGQFGLHEGDWEMVQFQLLGSGEQDWINPTVTTAVYAQHKSAEMLPWTEVEKSDGDVPIAYSALARTRTTSGRGSSRPRRCGTSRTARDTARARRSSTWTRIRRAGGGGRGAGVGPRRRLRTSSPAAPSDLRSTINGISPRHSHRARSLRIR